MDVLVNNAGAGVHVPVLDVEAADFRTILELNLVAPLRPMQAVAPGMPERDEGAVINISSGTTLPLAGVGAYAATKAALEQLSDVARAELDGTGVVVSILLPSLTKTEFSRSLIAGQPRHSSALARRALRGADRRVRRRAGPGDRGVRGEPRGAGLPRILSPGTDTVVG